MAKTYINKADVVRAIASSADLTQTKITEIINEVENEIVFALKTKGKVKIFGFGAFYFLKRASRTIKLVSSKSKRLLLERNELKFRASKFFKNNLLGIANLPKRPRTPAVRGKAAAVKIPVHHDKETASGRAKSEFPFKFKPLAILSRVDKEKIKKRIFERMMRLAGKPETAKSTLEMDLPTAVNLSKTMEDKVFASLLRQAIKNELGNIHFTLSDSPSVEISSGRPIKIMAKIPSDLMRKFLENRLEITHLGSPQERRMHLIIPGKPKLTFNLLVYMFPNMSGANLYFKISGVRVYNIS